MIATQTKTLHIERIFEVPQKRVFNAWASTEAMNKWFGLDTDSETEAKVDFREGGSYLMQAGPYTVRGVYKEISPYDKISFTWLWDHDQEVPEMLVSLEFAHTTTGTKMTLTQDNIADHERFEQHRKGWENGLLRFTKSIT